MTKRLSALGQRFCVCGSILVVYFMDLNTALGCEHGRHNLINLSIIPVCTSCWQLLMPWYQCWLHVIAVIDHTDCGIPLLLICAENLPVERWCDQYKPRAIAEMRLVALNLCEEVWKCVYIFYHFSILRRNLKSLNVENKDHQSCI